jgi:hypothetical protein
LHFDGALRIERSGLIRAVASAQHPIALGVLFATAFPLGLALSFGKNRAWWLPTGLLLVGVMASASRTPLLVFVGGGLVLLWLRPRDVKSLLPLVIPLMIAVKIALPGSIATLKNAFFPPGGIIQQQTVLTKEADPLLAGGRVRQLGPSLRESLRTPLLGQGFGTRQTGFDNPHRNAPILDNQWLSLILELGYIAVAGWAALFFGAVRGLGRSSRRRAGPDGWLPAGLAAAIAGFGIGMFTYDSLVFVQMSFVFWILVALSASYLLTDSDDAKAKTVR